MVVGEERRLLGPDECYFIAAGEQHGWKTFEKPVKLLDVSSRPQ